MFSNVDRSNAHISGELYGDKVERESGCEVNNNNIIIKT